MLRPAVLCLLISAPVHADHGPAPCAPPVEQTIQRRQVLLVPHEEETTLPRLTLREVPAGRACGGPVLDFREENRTVTEMRLVSRVIEKQVICTENETFQVTDPCTGQCRTECRPREVVKTVKVRVYEPVPTTRTVVVRVPVLKPGPDVAFKKLTLDASTVPAVKRTFGAVTTDSEIKVSVPVPGCLVAPACPSGRCR